MSQFWNERFAQDGYLYGTEPNAFLAHRYTLFPHRGHILLPGDGEGRNGVWLARRGFRVTVVDGSEVGLEKTRALAKRHGVQVETIHATLPDWTPEPSTYDGVASIYLHLPPAIRTQVHGSLARALKPGGVMLLEAFTPAQLAFSSGGPKDEALLYTTEMLAEDFAGLSIDALLELDTVLDEGHGHRGDARVIRMIAARQRD